MSDKILPCNGCTACCRGPNHWLRLEVEDIIDSDFQYLTEANMDKGIGIAHKSNGDCIYVGKGGCTIWENRPTLCRSYDCRHLLSAPAMSLVFPEIYKAAVELDKRMSDVEHT